MATKKKAGVSLIFLYVMRCDEALKVGVSRKPIGRLEQIQVCNPTLVTLEQLWILPRRSGFHVEYLLKEHLADFRIRGEWYYTTVDVIAATLEHHDYVPEYVTNELRQVPKEHTADSQALHRFLAEAELMAAPPAPSRKWVIHSGKFNKVGKKNGRGEEDARRRGFVK